MKRFLFVLSAVAVAATSAPTIADTAAPTPVPSAMPAAHASAVPVTVVLPAGTSVSVAFTQPVSSDDAKEGSQVPVVVTKEVDINGMAVIAKGAQGQATLTKVEHSGGNGSGGKVQFNIDWVYSVDGGKVALSATDNTTDNADRKGAASTAAIVGWATFGVLGLFSHNLAHGRAAVIPADKAFTVFVDHTVHVASDRNATSASGYDN